MNRYKICLVLLAAAVCFYSCKKDKKPTVITPPPITYPDYTVLKPGNYWIYQDYRLDSINGAAHPLGTFDSNYVEKDTVINGSTFHKYCDVAFASGTSTYNIYYLRDSLSYMINSSGEILFSSEDFTDIFKLYTYGPNAATPDTLTVTEQMGFKDVAITVDAGTFITSAFRQIYHYPASYPFGPTREYDHRYCQNVGLISETTGIYNSQPSLYERRLLRYHLN